MYVKLFKLQDVISKKADLEECSQKREKEMASTLEDENVKVVSLESDLNVLKADLETFKQKNEQLESKVNKLIYSYPLVDSQFLLL